MSYQCDRQNRSQRQPYRPYSSMDSYHPHSTMDVDPPNHSETNTSSRGEGIREQQRLQATVPPHGLVSPPHGISSPPRATTSATGSSIRRGPTHARPSQSAQELNQIGELYSQLAATTAQIEEYQLELDHMRREQDDAMREADEANREVHRLCQELENERRNHLARQEMPRQETATSLSSHLSSKGLFPSNPTVPSFSFTTTSLSAPIRALPPPCIESPIAPPQIVPTSTDTPNIPALLATASLESTTPQSGSMPPPPSTIPSHTVQVNPVKWEELKAACRKENEHNRKLKEQRKRFIAKNERKKRNGEEVEYNS